MNLSKNPVGLSAESAAGFAALGDPARVAILEALRDGTVCVCELSPRLGMPQNLLSYHLKILREGGLVRGERSGRRIEYSIVPAAIEGLRKALDALAPQPTGVVR